MAFDIYFDSRTTPSAIGGCLSRELGVDESAVFVGTGDELSAALDADVDVEYPYAWLYMSDAPGEEFGCVLQARAELPDLVGVVDVTTLAAVLCHRVGTRALVEVDANVDLWLLVTADGWYGPVLVDGEAFGEEDALVISAAVRPVPSEPNIPVYVAGGGEVPGWLAKAPAPGRVDVEGILGNGDGAG